MTHRENSFSVKVYSIISNFFNPLTSLFIFFVYMSFRKYTFAQAAAHFLPILATTIIPVIIWLVWNVRTGRYTNMDVSNRVQRKSLYLFAGTCMIVYLLFTFFKHHTIDFVMLFTFILLLALQISNTYIKSSMHTAFNVFVAALFLEFNWQIGIIWIFIAALVGFTRIKLKRHTLPEVLAGAAIAAIISFIYLYCSQKYI